MSEDFDPHAIAWAFVVLPLYFQLWVHQFRQHHMAQRHGPMIQLPHTCVRCPAGSI